MMKLKKIPPRTLKTCTCVINTPPKIPGLRSSSQYPTMISHEMNREQVRTILNPIQLRSIMIGSGL